MVSDIKKIKWRCRRGTKELDVILDEFINKHYLSLTAADKKNFAELLSCNDTQLSSYLCGGETPTQKNLKSIAARIRRAAYG